MTRKHTFSEDAPVNSVGAGGIAGLTGDPPVSLKAQKKHKNRILRRSLPKTGSFGEYETKIVSESTFQNILEGQYVSDELWEEISHGGGPLVIESELTGRVRFLKYSGS